MSEHIVINNEDTAYAVTMEPIYNQHLEGGGYVYLTRAYWVALVKTFGSRRHDHHASDEKHDGSDRRTFSDVDIIDSVIDLLDIQLRVACDCRSGPQVLRHHTDGRLGTGLACGLPSLRSGGPDWVQLSL